MPQKISPRIIERLDAVYAQYNRPEFIRPDPMQFLFDYADSSDREIAGLVASSLAFGTVKHILTSVGVVLDRMGGPRAYLDAVDRASIVRDFRDFRHRYVTGEHVSALLWGTAQVVREHGSVGACFAAHLDESDETLMPALHRFVSEIAARGGMPQNYLLPSPERGSACKRLNMYLRWMVREDAVDPGGWPGVPASKLVVPLDTHMFRIARALRLTRRNQANLATALEITAAFRTCAPEDPVKYDFALTRLGIRRDTDLPAFFKACGVRAVG
jgi:uncharacterized protein (TIGR02757 family)